MSQTKSCTIRLLNKPYEIKCPEHEVENLKRAAEKLNRHMFEKKEQFRQKQLDDFQILLLASLHISYELVHCQEEQEQRRQQLSQFINSLENKISEASDGIPPEKEPLSD